MWLNQKPKSRPSIAMNNLRKATALLSQAHGEYLENLCMGCHKDGHLESTLPMSGLG